MIKELDYKDRNLVLNMKNTPSALRIKGLFLAYGCGRSFVSFYADAGGDIVIAVKDNHSYLYIDDFDKAAEAADFLKRLVTCVLTDVDFTPLSAHQTESGRMFSLNCSDLPPCELAVSDAIESGRVVLEKVFPDVVNSTSYPIWFTDLSHRIRHSVSQIYTHEGICTATVYSNISGILHIVQLATLPEHRGKNHAMDLLSHIVCEQKANTIVVLSQSPASDKFYFKHHFLDIGEWFYYEW